jgi:transposase
VSITTTSRSETDWLYRGVGPLFPEAWDRFRDGVPEADRNGDLLAAYACLLANPDRAVRSRAAADLVLDNYLTHKTPAIHTWLLAHPRFHLRFTPTYSSWLNLVERWFAELTNRKLRRSAHRGVRMLETDIKSWIEAWNQDPKPFVRTKTADEIREAVAAYCQRINDSAH